MTLTAKYLPYRLIFKQPVGTSRGILQHKDTYFLLLYDGKKTGIGECALFKGLSADDRPDYEEKIKWLCRNIRLPQSVLKAELVEFPSLLMGLETAFFSLSAPSPFKPFISDFTEKNAPISINGLIWMGNEVEMLKQIEEKLNSGFTCIKVKIGAIDFSAECRLLKSIRKKFDAVSVEIRVDANGAFHPDEALDKLDVLAAFDLHSIEQPIKAGQWEKMNQLCAQTPLPIALDEELIGIFEPEKKAELLSFIHPQYIILKPTLVGGFSGAEAWIKLAEDSQIGWWVTSALESNIGLNAIAQWTYTLKSHLPQGLGTGSLFINNFESPLKVKRGCLFWEDSEKWSVPFI